MPVQVAVTLSAEAGVQSARATSPASSPIARAIAKTVTKDRAVAKMARRRSQRLGKDNSENPDFFIVKISRRGHRREAPAAQDIFNRITEAAQYEGGI